VQRFVRYLTIQLFAIAALMGAPQQAQSTPPAEPHRSVLTRVSPVYPELARRMHVFGAVTIRAVIQPNGTVSQTYVESGHALLQQAAEDAVRHWRFAPAAAGSECIVSVNFDPNSQLSR
jgi:TonB family protein